ncbi:hypothetical protein CC79DRAFT_1364085 [Sarocladium strictum]
MRACCRAQKSWFAPKPLSSTPRRWRSHNSASLNEEALLDKIEEGLGNAPDKPRVDPATKRVKTAAGELPISPLFDPKWIASRRRKTKEYNHKPSGRFRSKVYNNIFARALETPIRNCPMSKTALPRFFLQDFEAVEHPTTGKAWWAPGPLSFHHLDNDAGLKRGEGQEASRRAEVGKNAADDLEDRPEPEEGLDGTKQHKHHRGIPGRAPVSPYLTSKKSLISQVKPGKPLLLAAQRGMSLDTSMYDAVWRPDMADLLERMLRKQAVDSIVRRANREEGQDPHRFIEPCASWDDVKDVRLRGAVLWLPKEEVDGRGYPTFDVDAQFGAKMAVYNLPWLLGKDEVARLKEEAPMLRDQELLVLKQWPTWSVKSLHMLLWRLQGYLADSGDKPKEKRKKMRKL